MATMHCALCNRPVEAKRHIGVGTVTLAVLSGGLWLVAIPFYPRRCSICRSAAVTAVPAATLGSRAPSLAAPTDLERRLSIVEGELESAGTALQQLQAERDFYRELLGDRAPPGSRP